MTDFEQRLINSCSEDPQVTNSDEFLTRLHNRISESEENKRTVTASIMMLIVMSVLTMTQFGAPIIESDYFYYTDETDMIFETDFWIMSSDSLDAHESYTDDLAYFLLQEGNFWETVDLLNELELEEEITL
ncbi:MAG: hypothetical protein VX497_02865 [Candidatus Neomarinimicrobiota bacterium]|nr:hypothetical protein [Candidatus Neomarinimicrobiota bacterium]